MNPAATAAVSTPWWFAPAVIAALVAAVATIATLIVNGRRARVDRQRTAFADAFGDIEAYREFAYIVRRRRHDEPEAERSRISAELSAVQQKLNRHRAVLRVDAPRVAVAFAAMLDATRRIAGAAIRDGWNTPPITADRDIHLTLDLSVIEPFQDRYLEAVADHLALAPWWVRASGRWLRRTPGRGWRRARRDDATTTEVCVAAAT